MRISKDFPKDMVVVGVDLGGTNMQIGVVNAEGKVIGRCKRKTKSHEGRDEVIKRIEGAENQKAEGIKLCIDLIQEISEIKGVAGVHIMAYRQEESVGHIVTESGVLKGRQPFRRAFATAADSEMPPSAVGM